MWRLAQRQLELPGDDNYFCPPEPQPGDIGVPARAELDVVSDQQVKKMRTDLVKHGNLSRAAMEPSSIPSDDETETTTYSICFGSIPSWIWQR